MLYLFFLLRRPVEMQQTLTFSDLPAELLILHHTQFHRAACGKLTSH